MREKLTEWRDGLRAKYGEGTIHETVLHALALPWIVIIGIFGLVGRLVTAPFRWIDSL
jgi:hypothetical protein